jgi:hypothetical protein
MLHNFVVLHSVLWVDIKSLYFGLKLASEKFDQVPH